MSIRFSTATLLLLFPIVVQAQRGILRGGAGRAGREGIAEALADRNKLGEILAHKDTLKLTADQLKKLRALDSATTAKNAATMEKLRELRGDSGAAVAARPDQGFAGPAGNRLARTRASPSSI